MPEYEQYSVVAGVHKYDYSEMRVSLMAGRESDCKEVSSIMVPKEIKSRNDFFFEYFEHRSNFIRNIYKEHRLEAIILCCSYLDALGRYRFPEIRLKRERFTKIIFEYSEKREIWKKICIPLLGNYLLVHKPERYKYFEKLFRVLGMVENNISNIGFNPDCSIECMESKAKKSLMITPFSSEIKGEINKFRYADFFWKEYRNNVIHEASTFQNEAVNMDKNDESQEQPFYRHYLKEEGGKLIHEGWRIRFPDIFIINTLSDCISGFKKYIEENSLDIHVVARIK